MRNKIKHTGYGLLFLAMMAVSVAEFLPVEDFSDKQEAATIDGTIPNGMLGGFWDTEYENTGNITTRTEDGSMTLRLMAHSSGTLYRGGGISNLSNPIENMETGVLFFRFKVASGTAPLRDYMGMHVWTDADFLTTATCRAAYVNAGFGLFCPEGSPTFEVTTTDGAMVLKSGLERNQWYNVWIVANNAIDAFDLFINPAAGPGVDVDLPEPSDMVGQGIPFGVPTNQPLVGALFLKPADVPGIVSATVFIDDIYWDGDDGLELKTKAARNPVPAHRQTQVPLDQVLSWEAPNDPNIAAVLGYDVYLDPNEQNVAIGEPSALVSAGRTVTYYKPQVNFAFDTEYFWRVETTVQMDDPNQTIWVSPGAVWSFTTMTALPVITQQPVNVIAAIGQSATFSVEVESVKPVSYQWYKSADRATDTYEDDAAVPGADGPTLSLTEVSVDDEGFYYCKVSNPSAAYSEVASLGIKRKLAHWTLNKSDYDAVNELYLDTAGGYHAAVAVVGSVPVFVEGAAAAVSEGAVAFDPNTRGVVSVLNPSEFTEQMTLSAWVKWDGSPLGEFGNIILQKGPAWETLMWTWKLRQTGDGRAGVRFYNNFGYSAQTDNLIEKDVWSHVCVTWDGLAARVYINGILAAADMTGELGPDTRGDLLITGADDFPGALDEVRIYNTAFDPVEVAYLYVDVSGVSVCLNPNDPVLQVYDFNNDCVVNLSDVAEMASHWMECYQVPDCIERPTL